MPLSPNLERELFRALLAGETVKPDDAPPRIPGVSWSGVTWDDLVPLIKRGLLRRVGDHVELTDAGRSHAWDNRRRGVESSHLARVLKDLNLK